MFATRASSAPSTCGWRDGVTVLIRAFKGREYGLVRSDLDLALAISTAAAEIGLAADTTAIQTLSVIPGANDRVAIMPFWRAVLGYDPRPDSPDEDLVDPHGILPSAYRQEQGRAPGWMQSRWPRAAVHTGVPMLHYAVVFFVIALIAAVFGFGGIAAGAAGIAKILFVVFIILAIASFLFGRNRGR